MGLTAIVLGAAAGGGFPQWNCNCDVCRLAWAGDAPTAEQLADLHHRSHEDCFIANSVNCEVNVEP